MNVNARSIANKGLELQHLVFSHAPDVIAITETWLTNAVLDVEFVPNGFSCFRSDRVTRGGGTALLIKDTFQVIPLPPLDSVESVWCKLRTKEYCLVVACIYRPPISPPDVFSSITEYIHLNHLSRYRLILMGDFNLPSICWNTLRPGLRDGVTGQSLIDLATSLDLVQIVNCPTRTQLGTSSILDLVFLSSNIVVKGYTCDIVEGLSDHQAVLVRVNLRVPSVKRRVIQVRDFVNADDTAITDELSFALDNFVTLSTTSDINTLYEEFQKIVASCISRFVPVKFKKHNTEKPWITREILHLRRRIGRIRRSRVRGSSNYSHDLFISLVQELKSKMQAAKHFYFNTSLSNFLRSNPRKFWHSIIPKEQSPKSFIVGDIPCSDDYAIANHFNEYFSSVFNRGNGLANEPDFSVESTIPEISNLTFSASGICNQLLKLDCKKSSGPDTIPNTFLVRYAEWVSKYLHVIFTKSFSTGKVPNIWKKASVIPVFKSGDKQLFTNYRPISLTACTCKMFEHILCNHITSFIESHSLLSQSQHGFRRGYSTVTQLIEFVHSLASGINANSQTDVVFIDFSKAFDRVCHLKLMYKLRRLLNNDVIAAWIEDYLFGRTQNVLYNGCMSNETPVLSGVPQGSVLGPLLFSLFINDIVKGVPAKVRLYADDCVVYTTVNSCSDQILLQESLNKIVRWCDQWGMSINFNKCATMSFTCRRSSLLYEYKVDGVLINRVNYYKYLGVTLNAKLSWSEHIDGVCSKAMKKLGYLRRSLKSANTETKLLAYKTIIRPVLEYACEIWGPYRRSDIVKLESVQKKAVRFILSRYHPMFSPSAALPALSLSPLETRFRAIRMRTFHAIVNQNLRIPADHYLTFAGPSSLRSAHALNILPFSYRVDCFKFSFFPRCVDDWNALEGSARELPSNQFFQALLQ